MFEIDLRRTEIGTGGETAETIRELGAPLRPFAPVIAALGLVIALLWLADRSLDARLASRRTDVQNLEMAVNQTRQQLVELSGKRRAVTAVQPEEIYWSDQLRLLSEKLPDKTWLTGVHVITEGGEKGPDGRPAPILTRGLAVDGGVLSNPNEGNLDVIGKLIQDLRADERFQRTFGEIRLESMKRDNDPYTMRFQLELTFRSGSGGAA